MSTNDLFQPAALHTAADENDLKTLIEAHQASGHTNRKKAMLAHRRTLALAKNNPHKMSEKDKRAVLKVKNPLYSKALGGDGLNDGNQNRSQNGVPPHQGLISNLPGSMTYPGMGSGNP